MNTSENKGCLSGKTDPQKKEFFSSLKRFFKRDIDFFREQVLDLKESEKLEFIEYLIYSKNGAN